MHDRNTASPQISALHRLLRPGRLNSLAPRDVLLHAAKFSRIEPTFRPMRTAQGAPLVNLTVLSSLSAQHFTSVLKLYLYAEGLVPDFYLSEFDGIATEGNNPAAAAWGRASDVLLVLPAIDDIKTWPRVFSSKDDVNAWVRSTAQIFLDLWQFAAKRNPGCLVYQGLFVPPLERVLGNLERRHPFSKTNCVATLNSYLCEQCPAGVTLVDFEALSAVAGRRQWMSEVSYLTSKQPFSPREMPMVAANLARLMACAKGFVRKCLVLDLDNTLWSGVIGDEGVAGIRLDPNDPVGEAHLLFQRYVLALKDRGVLLAVCSKNEEALAREAFEHHPDMVLRLDDFAAFFANWDDKATNLHRISRVLNIGMDSLVFFDDNPAEREQVEQAAPEVWVIDVPEDPALFVRALDQSFAFEWPELTPEDVDRPASYTNNRKRHALETDSGDYDTYLRSLEMKMEIGTDDVNALARVCQLINKTNQFNFRTIRYTQGELENMLNDPDYEVFHVRLKDRFSNYGIIASAILRYHGEIAFLENWVMSCRVFKRGVEDATHNALVDAARRRGCQQMASHYCPTPKNRFVADLPAHFGWARCSPPLNLPFVVETSEPDAFYLTALAMVAPVPHHIIVTMPLQ